MPQQKKSPKKQKKKNATKRFDGKFLFSLKSFVSFSVVNMNKNYEQCYVMNSSFNYRNFSIKSA